MCSHGARRPPIQGPRDDPAALQALAPRCVSALRTLACLHPAVSPGETLQAIPKVKCSTPSLAPHTALRPGTGCGLTAPPCSALGLTEQEEGGTAGSEAGSWATPQAERPPETCGFPP